MKEENFLIISTLTLTFSFTTFLAVDWTYCQHCHSRILDSTSQLRGLSSAVPFAIVWPGHGRVDLWRRSNHAILYQHCVPLRILLQQRSDAQGRPASNGSRYDLRFHCWFILSLAEPWPHSTSLYCLCA